MPLADDCQTQAHADTRNPHGDIWGTCDWCSAPFDTRGALYRLRLKCSRQFAASVAVWAGKNWNPTGNTGGAFCCQKCTNAAARYHKHNGNWQKAVTHHRQHFNPHPRTRQQEPRP